MAESLDQLGERNADDVRTQAGRRLEWAFFGLLAATWLACHLVDLGLPPLWRTTLSWAALLAGAAAVIVGGRACRVIDAARLVLVALALWELPAIYGRVGGDGTEYFVLLRSAVMDHDLTFDNDYACLAARPVVTRTGEATSRFPIGLPLLWAPHYAAAHAVARVAALFSPQVRLDGCAPPDQMAVNRASFLYGCLALLVIDALLRRTYGPGLALVTTLTLWLATPLHFYMLANPSMSHAASAFCAALFLAAWLKARGGAGARLWLAAGGAGALLALVRVQDGVLLSLPLLDVVFSSTVRKARALAALLAPALAAALVQSGVWLALYGRGFAAVVLRQGRVARVAPQVVDFLFASRHGLFTWTPVYALAVLGCVLYLRRDLRLGTLFVLGIALAVLLDSAHGDWWGSDSFGQRRMLGLTPLFALGLAELLDVCRRRPLVPLAAALAALAVWNLQLEYVYNSELVANKTQAVPLDQLAAAEVDSVFRDVMRLEPSLPRPVFLLLYDNLRGVWLDEGPRQMHGLVDLAHEPRDLPQVIGQHWYDAEGEGDVTFRRARGRRAWLRIPIRTPDDFDLTIQARQTLAELPVEMTAEINGVELGCRALQLDWREFHFALPSRALRRGFNELALRFSGSPRADLPGYHGKDSAAAVSWLRFARRGAAPDRPAAARGD